MDYKLESKCMYPKTDINNFNRGIPELRFHPVQVTLPKRRKWNTVELQQTHERRQAPEPRIILTPFERKIIKSQAQFFTKITDTRIEVQGRIGTFNLVITPTHRLHYEHNSFQAVFAVFSVLRRFAAVWPVFNGLLFTPWYNLCP